MPLPKDLKLRPMAEFAPERDALVYDELNDDLFRWDPVEWAASYREQLPLDSEGRSSWDGLLLTGWFPALLASRADISTALRLRSLNDPAVLAAAEVVFERLVRRPGQSGSFDALDPRE